MRQLYRKHNLYVQSIVPKENLLVWNLKDGWEPLCKFLDKPIPKGKIFSWHHSSADTNTSSDEIRTYLKIYKVPVPHDNKTGDVEFVENYVSQNDFMKKVNYRN